MAKKPTYEELEHAINELEKEAIERRQAEKMLKDSELWLNSIFNSLEEAVLVLTPDRKLVNINEAGERMSGYSRDELVDLSVEVFHVDHEHFVEFGRRIQKAFDTGKTANFDFEIKRRDGEIFPTEHTAALLRGEHGEPIGILSVIRDVTEKKIAEKALRESEEKFSRLFMASPIYISFTTLNDGLFVEVNKAFSKITGYQPKEVLGRTSLEIGLFPNPEERAKFAKLAKEKGGFREQEITFVRKNGETWIGLWSAEKIELAGQTCLANVVLDITERKQAEQALRESEGQYRTLFENASEAIYVAQNGMIKFHNPKTEELYGYSKEELNSQPFTHFIHEKDREMVLDRHKRRLNGESPPSNYPFRIINKNGDARWVELNVAEISWDSRPAVLCFMTNIDERIRAEEALRESKDDLDKAQNLAHIGSWSRDLKTKQAQWSDEMYRIFGLIPGKPENPSHELFLSRVYPDDRERVASLLEKVTHERGSYEFEFRTVPINGSERIIQQQAQVESDEKGLPVRRFGTNQDVTEMRQLQTKLVEGQKMEAISTLAGGIAHNFNNALTPIIGNVDLLEMTYGNDENIMKPLKDMKTSGLRMAQLTSQLLAYAKGGKYDPQVQSLSDFVDVTLPLIQHTLDPAVRVETDLPLDVKDVEADSTQMQMVLSAIMANSNEAMEGPGRIRISTRNVDLDQELIKDYPGLKPGPHVCLSVEDDGKGMDEATRNRIFDPFFTTHFMGRGLGMAAVYGIVKNHDGAITVDSELGTGTVVRIYLPAIGAEKEVKKKVVSRPDLQLPKGDATILVIEDEEDVMMLIRQVLESLGYRVLEAETGKEAIRFAKTFDGQIDLALLDIKLPDMSGDRVYPIIMEARPDLKVIVCSGYGIEGPPQAILDAGAEGFIQKPFSISPFAEKLKEVLEGA